MRRTDGRSLTTVPSRGFGGKHTRLSVVHVFKVCGSSIAGPAAVCGLGGGRIGAECHGCWSECTGA